jgi:hypothetical protein
MNRISKFAGVCVVWLFTAPFGSASEPTEDDYIEHFKSNIGEWKMRMERPREHFEFLLSVKLSPTGRSFVMTSSLPGSRRADVQMLSGYDPGSKKWKEVSFFRGGGEATSYLLLEKGGKSNQVTLKVEKSQVEADGKSWSLAGTWNVSVVNPDKLEITASDAKFNGETQPDFKMTYERLKEPIVWEYESTESKAKSQ